MRRSETKHKTCTKLKRPLHYLLIHLGLLIEMQVSLSFLSRIHYREFIYAFIVGLDRISIKTLQIHFAKTKSSR